jgi:hypothetical protein
MTTEAELFDGTVLEFPDGTDPAIIQRKVKEITAQKRGPQLPTNAAGVADGPSTPAFADGDPRNAVVPAAPPTADETLLESIMGPAGRGLQVGLQGAGRGAADFLGMAGDISTGGANLGLAGVDNLVELIAGDMAPDALDFRFGPSPVGSDAIAGGAAAVSDAIGLGTIDPETMSTGERFGYAANRFGTTGLLSGAALATAAPAAVQSAAQTRATGQLPSAGQNINLALTSPYREGAGRTLFGDMAAGAGAGVGVEAVDQGVSDDAWYKPALTGLAALAGGAGGAGLAIAGAEGVPAMFQGALNRRVDYDLPLNADGTGRITRKVANEAARLMQETATNMPKARQNLGDNLASFPPGAPKPSPFTLTEDPGLRGLERGYRASGDPALTGKLEAQEQGASDFATERLLSILDEGADQPAALDAIRARPGEIKTARDDAALPLLREAEASGVTVNAQPVADILDAAMIGPKRPEVLRALEAARKSLDVKGTDTLDTSVRGLYESRKAISDLIDGRSDSNTGKFAQAELIEAKKALDEAIIAAEPRFGDYLDEFKAGSRPLDVFEGPLGKALLETETDLRNTAARILSPSRYGTEKDMADVRAMIGDNPEAQRGFKAAVADVLVDRVTKNKAGEEIKPNQIVSVYNQHRDTLAEVFSPEDMEVLDDVHNLVRLMETPQAEARTLNLASTRSVDPLATVQAALLATGRDMITTTMIMSRLKFVAKITGTESLTTPYKVNEVMKRVAFDPDLANMLLNRPVSEGTGRTWSQDVQALLAGAAFSRDMAAPDEDEEMTNQIMDGYGRDAYGRPLPAPEVGGP